MQFCHISGQSHFLSVYSYRVDHLGQGTRIQSASGICTHSKADCKTRPAYFIAPQNTAERGTYDRTAKKAHPGGH